MRKVFLLLSKMFQLFLFLALLALLVLLLPRLVTELHARGRIFQRVEDAPSARVAIVFGAGLWRDGSPTPILRDRVATAAELYFAGKVEKLLLSGDNRFVNYNEPEAMRQYARSLGVPQEALVLDYAGRRTYDTCYRAAAIFGVHEAILVTQAFHLPRALYLCNHLGVQASGLTADRQYYRRISRLYWNVRELLATLTALLDVHFLHPIPVLGQPEPIFPTQQSNSQP
jgi:SanA protein